MNTIEITRVVAADLDDLAVLFDGYRTFYHCAR